MKKRILVVEDDREIRLSLEEALCDAEYEARGVETAAEARRELAACPQTELVLLDLGLPDESGFALCGELKKAGGPPVIILTARDDEADIIRGLDTGADDYVTKPFPLGVLRSRIGAVLRRTAAARPDRQGEVLVCGDVRLDTRSTSVTVGGRPANLTAGEYRLLEYLLGHRGRTLTRSMLLERLWDMGGEFVGDKALTVSINRLREKLGGDPQRVIKTVRGIGYRAEDENEG